MLKALRFAPPSLGIDVTTGSFSETSAGRTVHVKTAAIYKKMSERSLKMSLESFRDDSGLVTSRFGVHLQFERSQVTE